MKYLSQQPWSTGVMFTVGASADGIAVFAQPKDSPPWLKASTMIFTTDSGYPIIYPGGAFRKSLTEFWLKKTVPRDYDNLIAQVRANEAPGQWWDRLNASLSYQNVNFPTVSWAGWYDIFLVGQLEGFYYYQYLSPSAGSHYIVIDPLGHCQKAAPYFPLNTFAGRAILPILLSLEVFKPTGQVPENVKAVTFYVMGSHGEIGAPGNYWTSLDRFPTPLPLNYYLVPGSSSNRGSLTPAEPTGVDGGMSTYIYDPTDPVPSTGGNNLEIKCGPLDQSPIEGRSDVLLFDSDVLTVPMAITGPISVTLFVASNATDTDFTAKLTDVYPTGESSLIQDGIVRMRWRNLPFATHPSPMESGRIYQVSISLWNTSFVFNAGHRVRLAISSSNYPRFEYNPNNMVPLNSTTPGPNITASNTVFYGSAQHPSSITLPIVQLKQLPQVPVELTTKQWLQSKSPELQTHILKHAQKQMEEREQGEKGMW
jgi:putative CocE/NonD family hydrolase